MDFANSSVKDNKRTQNVITTVYSISRLVEEILKRDTENLKSIGGEHPELKTLREQCKDKDVVVSSTACQAIVTLVQAGVITIPNTLTTFVAMLPYFVTPVGVTSALGQLLVLDMKMRLGPERNYKCPFNLQSPQHPLVTVLKQSKDAWHDVINQIVYLCNHHEEVVRENSNELVKPVVLFVMCDPSTTLTALPYRHQLWALLISLPSTTLLEWCLPWLQVEDLKGAQALYIQLSSSAKLDQFNEKRVLSKPHLALTLASLADTQVAKGQDPRPTLTALDQLLQTECSVFTGSIVTMILSNTVTSSPIIYLSALMFTCSHLLEQELCIPLAGQMLSASLLPWLAYPSVLTSEALRQAQTLLSKVDNLNGINITEAVFTSHPFPIANLCVRLYCLLGSWCDSSEPIVTWLKRLSLKSECSLLLGALLIHETSTTPVLSASLAALLDLVNKIPNYGTSVLTWLLYRLSRERDPNNQINLLKALPLLGGQKDNVTLVIHTLESLRGNDEMKPLVLNLYLKLWRKEPRCFPYLHKLLVEDKDSKIVNVHWEIARAVTMKEICELEPSKHGKDMVPLLSSLLNRCSNTNAVLPFSLALEAIVALCQAKVIDVATTWRTLSPRLSGTLDTPKIIRSCELLGLMSEMRTSNPDQKKLFLDCQRKLWIHITTSNNTDVVKAALKALSMFPRDQLSLKIMPESFRKDLTLPPEYAMTPIDAARKPEDVLPYIPGKCWVQLLSIIPDATILVKHYLLVELNLVSSMRGVLHQSARGEPSLPRLPVDSLCLALITHIKMKSSSVDPLVDPAVLPCLQTLDQPKVIPPCDWSFLSKLAQTEECRQLCFKIAAVQASTSPSAQAQAETHVKALYKEAKSTDILFGFSILGELCKGVAPNILRPFVENSLLMSLVASQSKDDKSDPPPICELLKYIKVALMKEDIHDANRTLLSILIESLLENMSLDNEEVFSCYVECVVELSGKFLERMTSPSVWWEVTSVKLVKAIHIRSHLATSIDCDKPLACLNECIDAVATNPREQEVLLKHMITVLQVSRDGNSSKDWLLQLMGHVQAALTSIDKQAEASFLCDVFTLAVIILAGHDSLVTHAHTLAENRDVRLLLVAQALHSLLSMPIYANITPQVIEWLHHVVKSSVIGEQLTHEFYICLQALRHFKAMHQTSVWQRIVTN